MRAEHGGRAGRGHASGGACQAGAGGGQEEAGRAEQAAEGVRRAQAAVRALSALDMHEPCRPAINLVQVRSHPGRWAHWYRGGLTPFSLRTWPSTHTRSRSEYSRVGNVPAAAGGRSSRRRCAASRRRWRARGASPTPRPRSPRCAQTSSACPPRRTKRCSCRSSSRIPCLLHPSQCPSLMPCDRLLLSLGPRSPPSQHKGFACPI